MAQPCVWRRSKDHDLSAIANHLRGICKLEVPGAEPRVMSHHMPLLRRYCRLFFGDPP